MVSRSACNRGGSFSNGPLPSNPSDASFSSFVNASSPDFVSCMYVDMELKFVQVVSGSWAFVIILCSTVLKTSWMFFHQVLTASVSARLPTGVRVWCNTVLVWSGVFRRFSAENPAAVKLAKLRHGCSQEQLFRGGSIQSIYFVALDGHWLLYAASRRFFSFSRFNSNERKRFYVDSKQQWQYSKF